MAGDREWVLRAADDVWHLRTMPRRADRLRGTTTACGLTLAARDPVVTWSGSDRPPSTARCPICDLAEGALAANEPEAGALSPKPSSGVVDGDDLAADDHPRQEFGGTSVAAPRHSRRGQDGRRIVVRDVLMANGMERGAADAWCDAWVAEAAGIGLQPNEAYWQLGAAWIRSSLGAARGRRP